MIWSAFILITASLALIGAVLALIWWFIATCREDTRETLADRAYRWREEMRGQSHERR